MPKCTADGHYATDVPLDDLQHFVNCAQPGAGHADDAARR